jgi:hypothetical protein
MEHLFEPDEPPKRLVQAKRVAEVYYGFGDTSHDGFGFNMQEQKGDTVHYWFRQWCDGVSEKTSNYHVLYNLVSRLEEPWKAVRCSLLLTTQPPKWLSTRAIHQANISTS